MIYLVYAPKKGGQQSLELVTNDLEKAKAKARVIRDRLLAKGWLSWANRVSVKKINSASFANSLANELVERGNTIDMMNQGRSFKGDNSVVAMGYAEGLYDWARLIRKELSNK